MSLWLSVAALAQQSAPAASSGAERPYTFKPFVGVEGGYDTNLNNRVRSQASPYEMLQVGANGSYVVSDNESYSLFLRHRYFHYDDLDIATRYDIDAALGARFDLSKATGLKLSASYYRDAISDNRADIFNALADAVHETDTSRTRIKLSSRTELNIGDDGQGDPDDDVFDVPRGSAFDYSKNGITASILGLRKEMFAPYVIVNYTNIDYFHQMPDPLINRRANEEWGVAGIRVTLSKAFYVDLGGRYNNRDFADPVIKHFSSSFFDGRFVWQPTDTLTIRGVIERQIKEPTTSFGLADDVRTHEVSFEQRIGSWAIYGRAFLDHIEPIGDTLVYDKYYWALGARYDVNINTEVYADYLGRYALEDTLDQHYDRHRVGAGVRMKY